MARDASQHDRSVSAAKEIEPEGLEGTRLENAPELGAAFDQGAGNDGLGPPAGIGSQQVQDSGQNHDMRPGPEIADQPDRFAHLDRMNGDQLRALQDRTERLLQSLEAKGDIGHTQDRGAEHNHDHGLER